MKYISLILLLFSVHSLKTNLRSHSEDLLMNDLFLSSMESNENAQHTTLSKLQTEVFNKMVNKEKEYSTDGYLNLNLIQKSITKEKGNNDEHRFLQVGKALPKPDDVMLEKLGLSNGIILYGNRRTANFASEGFGPAKEVEEGLSNIENLIDK
ncbi:MAG: hypothetical protein MJ252_11370 [archaeon]|nr:hypothetical protein [archaeon]